MFDDLLSVSLSTASFGCDMYAYVRHSISAGIHPPLPKRTHVAWSIIIHKRLHGICCEVDNTIIAIAHVGRGKTDTSCTEDNGLFNMVSSQSLDELNAVHLCFSIYAEDFINNKY